MLVWKLENVACVIIYSIHVTPYIRTVQTLISIFGPVIVITNRSRTASVTTGCNDTVWYIPPPPVRTYSLLIIIRPLFKTRRHVRRKGYVRETFTARSVTSSWRAPIYKRTCHDERITLSVITTVTVAHKSRGPICY